MKKCLMFFLLVVAVPVFGQSNFDLYTLCKVWGLMKYHHPAIMSGEYDMDQELFSMLDKFKAVKNIKQRNKLFSEWVAKFGPVTTEEKHIIDDPVNFRQIPDFSWIDKKAFGKKLEGQLSDVKNAIRPDASYYVGCKGSINNYFFQKEQPYDVDFTKSKYAILGLFRFWNAIEYFFPYKYLNDSDWDRVLFDAVPRFATVESRGEYIDKLRKLTAYVNDSHIGIMGIADPYNTVNVGYELLQKMFCYEQVPVTTVYSNGQLIVTGYKGTHGNECGLEPGDVVLEIDGADVDSFLKVRSNYHGVSNWASGCEIKLKKDLLTSFKDTLLVKCLRRGQEIAIKTTPILFQPNDIKEESPVKRLKANYIYADVSALDSLLIAEIFEQPSNGLILDLRQYPRDGSLMDLVNAYIHPEPTPYVRFSEVDVANPGYFRMGECGLAGVKNNNYYQNPIVILVSGGTMSHAEFFTMSCQCADHVIVIGSQTAGADGNICTLPLPGNLSVTFSGLGVYYPDRRETQRVGVRIDEIVYPTPEGIREGRDELLERVEEIIDAARKLSPCIPK